jgi:hypothetical protein
MGRDIWLALMVGLALGACSGKDSLTEDDTDSDSDTDTNQTNDGMTPFVESGIVFCIDSGQSAGIIWNWQVTADDEQGPFTLKSLNEIGAYTVQGEAEIFKQSLLACNDEGDCLGTLREDQAGILCRNHDQYLFKAFISDDDDNISEPFTLQWSDSIPE